MMTRSHAYAYALFIVLLVTAAIALHGCGGDSSATVFQNVSERTTWSVNNEIAFASFGGNGLLYVWKINASGGGLLLLTPSDNDEDLADEGGRHPAFSPDGTVLAISTRRGETPAIFLMDAQRGDRDRITAVTSGAGDGADTEPSFAPNGTQIVFTSTRRDGNADIRIVGSDGSGNAPLIETEAEEHWGVISPDGTKLAYSSDAAGNSDIWVKDISNLGEEGYDPADPGVNLTAASPFREEAPCWSPDGSKIAFHSNRNGDFDIFLMNADGSDPVAVTADQRSDGFPVFSPSGEELVITRDREIWRVPARPWTEWAANADQLSRQLTRRY